MEGVPRVTGFLNINATKMGRRSIRTIADTRRDKDALGMQQRERRRKLITFGQLQNLNQISSFEVSRRSLHISGAVHIEKWKANCKWDGLKMKWVGICEWNGLQANGPGNISDKLLTKWGKTKSVVFIVKIYDLVFATTLFANIISIFEWQAHDCGQM